MSEFFSKTDIHPGYLLRVRDTFTEGTFNMTVVPSEVGLGCCSPGLHWCDLNSFDDDLLKNGQYVVEAVYGRTSNMRLLSNSTENRSLLWERHKETASFSKKDLKDGMFLRISDGSWGVIVGDLVVCDDGYHVLLSELRDDLTWELAGSIQVVLDGVTCFGAAKRTSLDSSRVKYLRPGVEA